MSAVFGEAPGGDAVPAWVRTPEECFDGLVGFPFTPRYLPVPWPAGGSDLRMHYIDEGPRDGPLFLLAHGEPSWSYLYRHMIPVFTAAGCRVVVPDFIGFGRSDKPTRPWDYSFAQHIDWLEALIAGLDLQDIHLLCQDWGGPVSLGVLARQPRRFATVVVANTMLHTAGADLAGRTTWAAHASSDSEATVNTALLDWARHSMRASRFVASDSLQLATVRELRSEEMAAYDAPFPGEWYKAGMRQFPLLIPLTDSDAGAAINRDTWSVLKSFERPFLTLFSDSDPTTRGWDALFQERVPGASGQPHAILPAAGHFWQEDCGALAAQQILAWLKSVF